MSPDDLWAALAGPLGVLDARPDFRLDPAFDGAAGAHRTAYAALRAQAPHIDLPLAALVTHPALGALIAEGHPDALELAHELIALGAPVDRQVSWFSHRTYLEWYPDIAAAGMNPLMHYLRFGWVEGGRRTLADLHQDLHRGRQPLRPDLPTLLVCTHSLASGADPALVDLLRHPGLGGHNLILAALSGGPMLETLLPECCAVLITPHPLREMPHIDDAGFDRIDTAILSSAEAALFAHPLVAQEIPFAVCLADYPDPPLARWKSRCVTAFADLLVFSSDHLRDRWAGRLADVGADAGTDGVVIPPRPLTPGTVAPADRKAARTALSQVVGQDLDGRRVICGTGPLDWRHGPDLFAQAARIAARSHPEMLFVWACTGLDRHEPCRDAAFGRHLRDLCADGPVILLRDGPPADRVMQAADAMFLSARQAALPEAVFDAVSHGLPVVCLDRATGFADARYRRAGPITVVAPGDPLDALTAMSATPATVAQPEAPAPWRDAILSALRMRLARQRLAVVGESRFDIPQLFSASEADRPLRRRERERLFRLDRRVLWRDADHARAVVAASDNWLHRRLRIEDDRPLPTDADLPPFAIHVHAFHLDDLAADLGGHLAFARASRIVITTDTPAKAARIGAMADGLGLTVQVLVVPNQGRDILPFLRLFGRGGAAGDDLIWCHLHQKKSLRAAAHGDRWRRFLHRVLLGDGGGLSSALGQIAAPGVGLVAPFDPHVVSWDDQRPLLPGVADRFPGLLPDHPLLFPLGNMFWTRADVAREMLALFTEDYPWPTEPIPDDGTVYHLIERLWPAVAARMGLASVFIHNPDEARI
ncbi:MAG: rhamnan synthesis F family protein [Paracoccus hibiscisoli]|uniref:rhamnan synthesis F family protein n=1 Tax=Paracoccus hibiscisoli TaxID=2023261 RepID=UPI00391B7DA7